MNFNSIINKATIKIYHSISRPQVLFRRSAIVLCRQTAGRLEVVLEARSAGRLLPTLHRRGRRSMSDRPLGNLRWPTWSSYDHLPTIGRASAGSQGCLGASCEILKSCMLLHTRTRLEHIGTCIFDGTIRT